MKLGSGRRTAGVLLATTGLSLGALAAALPTQTAVAAGAGGDGCVAPTSVTRVDADSGHSSAASSAATVTTFQSASTTVTFRTPPRSWNPLTATDTELDFYGLPARPHDAEGLASWTTEFRHYSGFGPPQYCGGTGESIPGSQPAADSAWVLLPGHYGSHNWAGIEVPQASGTSAFKYVYGHTFVPYNFGGCTSDGHAAWVGLGGEGPPHWPRTEWWMTRLGFACGGR